MRNLVITLAVVLATTVSLASLSVMLSGTHPPDIDTASSDEIMDYLCSPVFKESQGPHQTLYVKKLFFSPSGRRAEVLMRFERLSQEKRQTFLDNITPSLRKLMVQEAGRFCRMTRKDRLVHIDRRIHEMDAIWEESDEERFKMNETHSTQSASGSDNVSRYAGMDRGQLEELLRNVLRGTSIEEKVDVFQYFLDFKTRRRYWHRKQPGLVAASSVH